MIIADDLSRRGIAVLRYDDRGFGETKGNVLDSTSEEFADDVLAAIESISKMPEIDPRRIGLIGHSEGGMVAMIAASKSPRIAFVVSIAGVAQDCKELAWSTLERLVQPDRMIQPARAVTRLAMRRALTLLQSDASDAEVKKEFGALLPADVVPRVVCRWTRFMARYDPGPAIEKVKCPILGLFAGHDLLVPAKENSEALRDSAEIGGNEDVTIVTYPAFDHFFLAIPIGAAASRPAQALLAPEVLDQIGRWVVAKTMPRSASRPEPR